MTCVIHRYLLLCHHGAQRTELASSLGLSCFTPIHFLSQSSHAGSEEQRKCVHSNVRCWLYFMLSLCQCALAAHGDTSLYSDFQMPLAGVRWPVFIPMGGNGWSFSPWQDHGVDLKVQVWFSISLCLSALFLCLAMHLNKTKLPSACCVWYFCLLNFYGVQRGELPHLSHPSFSVL